MEEVTGEVRFLRQQLRTRQDVRGFGGNSTSRGVSDWRWESGPLKKYWRRARVRSQTPDSCMSGSSCSKKQGRAAETVEAGTLLAVSWMRSRSQMKLRSLTRSDKMETKCDINARTSWPKSLSHTEREETKREKMQEERTTQEEKEHELQECDLADKQQRKNNSNNERGWLPDDAEPRSA